MVSIDDHNHKGLTSLSLCTTIGPLEDIRHTCTAPQMLPDCK